MNKLKTLENYCIGTAEAELSFLEKTFVDDDKYHDILLTPTGSPTIMIGKKGSGKTAILQFINITSKRSGISALYLKPDDMPLLDRIGEEQDLSTLKRKSFDAIIDCLAIKLGSELRGLISNKEKRLFDKAVTSGQKNNDFVQMTMKGLSKFGSVVTSVDFEKLIPKNGESNTRQLTEAVKENFESNRDKVFFLLLDDIDQLASPSQANQVNRIWAFILAAKKFSETFPNAKCIISLRTEIFYQLLNDSHGQRDQYDHISTLTTDLDPTEEQIKKIVLKRIEFVKKQITGNNHDYIEYFFDDKSVVIPTTDGETRSWEDYITKASRERPRDSIQFLGLLAKKSNEEKLEKISSKIVNDASYQFAKGRVTELALEYAPECKQVEDLVKLFSKVDFKLETEDAKNFLNTIPSSLNVSIRGKIIHQDNVEEIFALWNFLHQIGFLNPCTPDNRQKRNFRHIRFKEDRNFTSQSNWNNMQKVIWEIHPAYRSYLLKIKEDDKARIGISFKKFFSNIVF